MFDGSCFEVLQEQKQRTRSNENQKPSERGRTRVEKVKLGMSAFNNPGIPVGSQPFLLF